MNHERILQRAMAQEPAASKGAPVSVAGKWVNEYDSSAEFVVSGNSLSGRYVSKAGGVLEGSITGYISGDIIAFSVLWPAAAGSITSWVGMPAAHASSAVTGTGLPRGSSMRPVAVKAAERIARASSKGDMAHGERDAFPLSLAVPTKVRLRPKLQDLPRANMVCLFDGARPSSDAPLTCGTRRPRALGSHRARNATGKFFDPNREYQEQIRELKRTQLAHVYLEDDPGRRRPRVGV